MNTNLLEAAVYTFSSIVFIRCSISLSFYNLCHIFHLLHIQAVVTNKYHTTTLSKLVSYIIEAREMQWMLLLKLHKLPVIRAHPETAELRNGVSLSKKQYSVSPQFSTDCAVAGALTIYTARTTQVEWNIVTSRVVNSFSSNGRDTRIMN